MDHDSRLAESTAVRLLSGDSASLRAAAAENLGRALLAPVTVEAYLESTLREPRDTRELQRAIKLAPSLSSSGPMIRELMDRLVSDALPSEAILEAIEVATEAAKSDPEVAAKLKQYRSQIESQDLLRGYSAALRGGDPEVGSQIFHTHAQAQCTKCHALQLTDKQLGPSLEGIGKRVPREYLLQSIVDPPAKILPGYGVVTLLLDDGSVVQGVLANQSESSVTLRLPDNSTKEIPTSEIEEQTEPTTTMPDPRLILTMRQIRDLVAFLATL